MKPAFVAALLLFGPLGSSVTSLAAEPDVYLFDVLRHYQYHYELTRLLNGKAVPQWVDAFLKEGDGVASPSKTVELGGKSYRLDHLCKVHDCAGNVLVVLWAPRGLRAWAALMEGGRPPTMFGNPAADQAQALAAALKAN